MQRLRFGPGAALAAAALLLAFACGEKRPGGNAEFTLIADSLGDVPMNADALKLDNLAQAHDGSHATRWTSVCNMEPGFFVELEFPRKRKVAGFTLDSAPSPNDYPRAFVVEVSADGDNWSEVARAGPKTTRGGVTAVVFDKPYGVTHILVTLTKGAPYWWSIYEIEVKYAD